MNHIESFITAHIGDPINECDDNFAYNLSEGRFVVSDGSSSDYFSKIYAELLTDAYVADGETIYTKEQIGQINDTWRERVKETLDKAGCKAGSFPYVRYQRRDPGCATIIGLAIHQKENNNKVFSCSGLGDSVLFFRPKDNKIPSFQFSSDFNKDFSLDQSIEFGYTPVISNSISTEWLQDVITHECPLEEGVFYLMTDGMAEWVLRTDNGEIEEKFANLDSIHSQEDFLNYVNKIRESGAKNDDMTLMKVYIDNSNELFWSEEDCIIYDYRKFAAEEDERLFQKRQAYLREKEKKAKQQQDQENFQQSDNKTKEAEYERGTKSSKSSMSDILSAAFSKCDSQNKAKAERKKNDKNIHDIVSAASTKVAEEEKKIEIAVKDEETRTVTNKVAYEVDLAVLRTLQEVLETTHCTFALRKFDFEITKLSDIQKQIKDLLLKAEEIYKTVQNNGIYSLQINNSELYSGIAEVLTETQSLKTDADRVEQTRQATNKMAYEVDLATIKTLEEALKATKSTINVYYADFANSDVFTCAEKLIEDTIKSISSAYLAVKTSGVYACTFSRKTISEAIANIVPQIQEIKEAEIKRQENNKIEYDADIDAINNLQIALDKVISDYSYYVDDTEIACVQKMIEELRRVANVAIDLVKDEGKYTTDFDFGTIQGNIEGIIKTMGFKKKIIDAGKFINKGWKPIAIVLFVIIIIIVVYWVRYSSEEEAKQSQDNVKTEISRNK